LRHLRGSTLDRRRVLPDATVSVAEGVHATTRTEVGMATIESARELRSIRVELPDEELAA
jgi:hypothetical protein